MKFIREEIIGKALDKLPEPGQTIETTLDIPVDMEDEHQLLHSYVVSFKKNDSGDRWTVLDVSEISAQA